MSTHIAASKGQVAPFVLLPGDPLRAKVIAEVFLENSECINTVRGMLGFTGIYNGVRVSVQGTGMGIPSMSIYATELICDYDVQTLIRVGTCGAFPDDLKVRDLVLAQAASTDSAFNKLKFSGMDYAAVADFNLLVKAWQTARNHGLAIRVGNVLTSDFFYTHDIDNPYEIWQRYGILAVEMETAALYTIAARFGRKALSVLTVSNHMITGESLPAEEREKSFLDMAKVALEIALEKNDNH